MYKFQLSLIGLLSLALSASAQNLIVNGGFENPVGGGQGVSLGAWTASSNVVSIINATSNNASGHGGNQVLDLGGNLGFATGAKATVYQDVFVPAGLGTLGFKWGQRLDNTLNTNYLSWSLGNSSYTLAAGNFTPFPVGMPLDSYYSGFEAFVVPVSAVYRLRFHEVGQPAAGNGTLIDDVYLTSSAVPEPATLAVLGLGALLLRRRAKR